MSKKTEKTSVKTHKKRPTKESKLDAIYYVFEHPDLNNIERVVATYLIKKARFCPQSNLEEANLDSFDGPGYYVRYTQSDLAEQMKVSRATVSRAVKKLNDEGLIHNHPGGIKPGEYSYKGVAFVCIPMMKKKRAEQSY